MNTKIILGNELAIERGSIIQSASQDLSSDDRNIASLDKDEAIVGSNFTMLPIPIKIPLFEDIVRENFQEPSYRITKVFRNYMLHKFAHITDCHLGAWRNPKLKEINLKAFQKAISICVEEKVDFIAITGDFFDVNVPELDHVKRAVDIMRQARRHGIEIYMIYGSHDFTASDSINNRYTS